MILYSKKLYSENTFSNNFNVFLYTHVLQFQNFLSLLVKIALNLNK